MVRRKGQDEVDPARSVRDEFYPAGRKGGIIVRIQVDYSRGGKLLRYSLALIDTRVARDNGRIVGYDNAHGRYHRHCVGVEESVEFESYEKLEAHFEDEVRRYLSTGEI